MAHETIEQFARRCTIATRRVLKMEGLYAKPINRFHCARYLSIEYRLAGGKKELDKALKLGDTMAMVANVQTVGVMRTKGLVSYHFQFDDEALYKVYHLNDLDPGTIGISGKNERVEFLPPSTFTQADFNPMTLVAGEPRSGKTIGIADILFALIGLRSPNNLRLIICDGNAELEDFRGIAHLERPIAWDNESRSKLIAFVAGILTHRKTNRIKDPSQLLVLVIDETEGLTESDLIYLRTIAKEGAKFFIWLVIGTQKPTRQELPGIFELLGNRFLGKVTDAHESHLISGLPGLKANMLTGRGDFIKVAGENSRRFQFALPTQADYQRLDRGAVQTLGEVMIPEPTRIESSNGTQESASKGGRPLSVLVDDWYTLGFYVHHSGQISPALAGRQFGFTKYQNGKYNEAGSKVARALTILQKRGRRQ